MNVPGVPLVWRVEKVKKCVQVWRHLRTPPDIIFLGDIDPVGLGRPQKSQEGNDRWQSKYLGGALAQAPSILLIYPSLVGPPVFLGGSPTVGCPPDLHRGSALRPRASAFRSVGSWFREVGPPPASIASASRPGDRFSGRKERRRGGRRGDLATGNGVLVDLFYRRPSVQNKEANR